MLHSSIDLDKLSLDCKRRGYKNFQQARNIYEQFKAVKRNLEQQRHIHNQNNNNIQQDPVDITTAKEQKQRIKDLEQQLQVLQIKLDKYQDQVPNYLNTKVPNGSSESDNVVIKQHGEFYWCGKHHYDMEGYQQSAAGSRLPQLSGQLSKLNRKLLNFAMDFLIQNGFQEYHLPVLFPVSHFRKTGHYSNPEQQIFHIKQDNAQSPEFALIPTSELSLLSLLYKKTLKNTEKLCSYSLCFRKEAGSAGKDNKGLIRSHQFTKIEMVVGSLPTDSENILDEMVTISCSLLEKLGLSYRVVLLCSGDVGVGATITYDLEVPIGGLWREVASLSNCETKQSIGLKLKTSTGEYAHTLNGTALALDRIIAALMEKYYHPINKNYNFDKNFNLI